MAKQRKPDPPKDIPAWLMTFSDVITLLMTFFILLLTFATSEPEKFERMQVAMFGGGGATGVAGEPHGPLEKDSVLSRVRPRSGRMTVRGSEMPPIDSDPSYSSLAKGLAGLEESERRQPSMSHAIQMPLKLLLAEDDSISALGRQRMRMIARHLRKDPFQLSIQVATTEDITQAVALALHLVREEAIPAQKIDVALRPVRGLVPRSARLVVTKKPRDS